MAKAPLPGRVKTRLQPVFTPGQCAEIQEALIRRTERWALEVAPEAAFMACDRPEAVCARATVFSQSEGHLGRRLEHATAQVWQRHPGPLLVVGVDTRLTAAHADAALGHLAAGKEVVFGPALDGGYYLVALARPMPEVFAIDPAAWGGPAVLERSLSAARAAGLSVATLDPERDLDTPADAEALIDDPELAPLLRRGLVSVVVPVLDEAATVPALLDHLASLEGRFEVIVADGGSYDGTPDLAARHPLAPRVVRAPQGRAAQLNAGAAAARGELLVFLHADTRLPPSAHRSLGATAADGGNFRIRFDGGDRFSRVLGHWYALQRRLGVYYGDSAIWLRRGVFDALGGFRPLPIMEDYDLARRLERGFRTACLPGPATTSGRRWRALGVPRTVLSWVAIRWLFLAGVPPDRLARLYRRVR
jgi:rSAM/selenodomain-associated transferase 2/rSAM/selenodomain-associated transferase 1